MQVKLLTMSGTRNGLRFNTAFDKQIPYSFQCPTKALLHVDVEKPFDNTRY